MDTDMTDAAYDIDLDVDPGIEIEAQSVPPARDVETQVNDDGDAPMPAAYFESLETFEPWPESVNLQGVSDFGPNDPLDYALEHCPERSVKRLRWVNDGSVNLEYYTPEDAADALSALTDPEAGHAASIPAQTSRKAIGYSKKPDSVLTVRECNSGDQKAKRAAVRSEFYRKNPQARERDRERDREQEAGRRRPQRDYLDYDGVEAAGPKRRSMSFDESMYDDSSSPNGVEASRDRRNNRRGRGGNGNRDWGGRNRDVDSYRPGLKSSPRESHFGRLRGRSASPASDEDGDGRLGFAEDGSNMRSRYRSRSRSRSHIDRRRRAPSGERWTHDRSAAFADRDDRSRSGGRWAKSSHQSRDVFPHKVDMGSNHRRTDATDETANKGSLLSRMTKDGQPVLPPRSLASRITRDGGESSYGRLKNDNSLPRDEDFAEPAPKRDLASRITKDNDDFNIRGRSDQSSGFNIRGSAPQAPSFSIRGAAGGA